MSSSNKLITRRNMIAGAATLPVVSACGLLSNVNSLDQRAALVRQQMFSQYPAAAQASEAAAASILFPEIYKGALLGFGGAHGDGVMYVNGAVVGRYNMTSATIGLQAGIQSFSMLLLLMTPETVARFRSSLGLDFGLDVEYALPRSGINYGANASQVGQKVYALIFNQAGLMLGASLQGAKYTAIS